MSSSIVGVHVWEHVSTGDSIKYKKEARAREEERRFARNISYPNTLYYRNKDLDSRVNQKVAIELINAIKADRLNEVQKIIYQNPELVNYEVDLSKPGELTASYYAPIRTSLIWASDSVTNFLLDNGADVTSKNLVFPNSSSQPVSLAVSYGKLKVLDKMFQKGANPHTIIDGLIRSWTLLELAHEEDSSGKTASIISRYITPVIVPPSIQKVRSRL